MRLRMTEILGFYDIPQLFVAQDIVGTSYLCLLYDTDENGRSLCIAANISKERLNDLVTGHIDLRQVFTEPEMSLYDVTEDGDAIIATVRMAIPTEAMLPDEGYYLNFSKRENYDMVMATLETRKTIIRLGFNYETNNHTIPMEVLTGTVTSFQAILSSAYRKVAKTRDLAPARLSVRATIAASFDLEIEASESTDIFGCSKVAQTLNMLSPLFGCEDDAVANCLATFKGAQKSYKNLLKSLSSRNVSFKCKWVQQTADAVVNELPVTQDRIHSLYSLASSLESLADNEVEFEGHFFMANVHNGRWGLDPLNHERPKYGVCLDAKTLIGIVLKDKLYKIKCTEKQTKNSNTGKVYKTYILTDIHTQ